MKADGTSQTALATISTNRGPAWSPDGSKIAFYSDRDDPNNGWQIYVMNADGSAQTRLIDTPSRDGHPAWSPDGSRIAFQSDRDGGENIHVMNADGSDQSRLTNDTSLDDIGAGAWSPDGLHLTFRSNRGGSGAIYTMNADGTNQVRLSDSVPNRWSSWSPFLPSDQPPVAVASVTPYVASVGSQFAFDGSHSYDPDGSIVQYSWSFGDGAASNGSSTAHTYSAAGLYTVALTVTDNGGLQATDTAYVVAYDPDGGFMTGGGWINSPVGAYIPNPTLTGKATFGFVSKYQNGADVPTGNTEFQFHDGNLNFSGTSYDWLVVTGSNYARFKGSGTINGSGNYEFMLSAGDQTGSGGADTFRIKIDGPSGTVYDNGMDQAIGGGSIVVHDK